MVAALRSDPGSRGLVTGLGWYLTKHSVGIYGTDPGPRPGPPRHGSLPDGTVLAEAGGFAWANPQSAVGALPQCAPDTDAQGEVTVETYSVTYDRGGSPVRAVVACRTPGGRRAWAKVTEPGHLDLLVTEEGCGRLGKLRPDGEVDLR
jgi:acetyl-CoA C-acetyltransferase